MVANILHDPLVSIHLQISECGGKVFSNVIYGPSRLNGLSSRGANCVWEIQTSQNNTGTVYVIKFRYIVHNQ